MNRPSVKVSHIFDIQIMDAAVFGKINIAQRTRNSNPSRIRAVPHDAASASTRYNPLGHREERKKRTAHLLVAVLLPRWRSRSSSPKGGMIVREAGGNRPKGGRAQPKMLRQTA